MSWRDFFKSSHALFLEKEVAYYKEQLAELKKANAAELLHANTIADKLRDELQRTRILISPGLQGVALPHEHDDDTPPPTTEVVTGTPWQRVRAQMIKDDEARWRKAQATQEALAKGVKQDGVSGQDGEGPPLGKQSTSV